MTRVISRGYTDIAVIVGRNMRDAEDLYRRIKDQRPENLLGYDIYLAPVNVRYVEGLRVHDFFISQWARGHEDFEDVYASLYRSMVYSRRVPHWKTRRSLEESGVKVMM